MTEEIATYEVTDRQSFSEFLKLVLVDFEKNSQEWENNRLELFLEAMQRYSEDLDGFYKNVHPDLDANQPTWRAFSDIIKGAIIYE
ncbi:MAG: hypothetical protein NXI00_06935 [Cytophagales bacterium]|nr:hypothetical protein [Cytophagales bacterium]